MKQVIRRVSASVYQKGFKPIAFKMAPDGVHERMVKTGRLAHRLVVVEPILRGFWAHHDETILGQTVFGLHFKNPVGLSAGLDKNANLPPVMRAVGFGFATVGSITADAAPGNPKPWYHRLPHTQSLVVNAGLPNQGADRINVRISRYNAHLFEDFPLVASVAKTNSSKTSTDAAGIADYVEGIVKLQFNPHIAMFELNISCPNAFGGEPFTRPDALDELLSAIDKLSLTQPLTVKMPIDKPWKEFDTLLGIIVRHNVQAVTIGNLQKDRKAIKLKDKLDDEIPGNLSGKPCFDASNSLIAQTYAKYSEALVIIGVGGIFSAEDAYKKIRLGATLVELITGVIFNGPQLIGQINHDLAVFVHRDGYKNISEAIGVDNR
jgi:dihydroorotate dehydrogenase (fumarate)